MTSPFNPYPHPHPNPRYVGELVAYKETTGAYNKEKERSQVG